MARPKERRTQLHEVDGLDDQGHAQVDEQRNQRSTMHSAAKLTAKVQEQTADGVLRALLVRVHQENRKHNSAVEQSAEEQLPRRGRRAGAEVAEEGAALCATAAVQPTARAAPTNNDVFQAQTKNYARELQEAVADHNDERRRGAGAATGEAARRPANLALDDRHHEIQNQ